MTKQDYKTIKVAAAVICRNDCVFAVQRGYGEFKGMWEFPGGKLEPGETSEQTLLREIKEELNTEIEVGSFLTQVEQDYPSFHLSMSCFWATIRKGSLELLEAMDARWLKAEELDSVDWLPADRSVCEAIRNEQAERTRNNK